MGLLDYIIGPEVETITCPGCKSENDIERFICWSCGYVFETLPCGCGG